MMTSTLPITTRFAVLLLASSKLSAMCPAAEAASGERPNFLWITAEDICSYDNIPEMTPLTRACMIDSTPAKPKLTRETYLP